MTLRPKSAPLRCDCQARHFTRVFSYDAPPEREVRFTFSAGGRYEREVWQCGVCRHLVSLHEMDPGPLYSGEYVSSTYGDDGIATAFERIAALPPERSDNAGRVARIVDFAKGHFGPRTIAPAVLDVGSGLCVFLNALKVHGWRCTALDPDARAVRHARERVGIAAVQGTFESAAALGRFDVITFNKVLEHVDDPIAMLEKAALHLERSGFVYVEVPDGEVAARDGKDREEFFIDHPHVFSAASLALLAARAGFDVRALERLKEPSTKYTLRAFLVARRP
ncbi:MAG: class I SAM-dependent methyltransferase [Chloroflexi bacterium]|nr:class I SAM-dependent methyltransferase [Chloroflexota bacterium]